MSSDAAKGGLVLLLLFLMGAGGEKPEPEPEPEPDPIGPDKVKPPDPGPEPEPEPKPEPDKNTPEVDDITNLEWPTPGHFYVVQKGDFMFGIVVKALKDAAFRAAKKYLGYTDDEARTFASNFASDTSRQYQYLYAIICESWNDATVTTYGYGDKTVPSPESKRAIRLLPQHEDNLARLRNGQRAIREMNYGKATDRSNGIKRSGGGSHYETLYMPGLNLKVLAEKQQLKIGGGSWPDGSSKANPPQWVLDLGVKDRSKSIAQYKGPRGCGDNRVPIEVLW